MALPYLKHHSACTARRHTELHCIALYPSLLEHVVLGPYSVASVGVCIATQCSQIQMN